MKSSPRRLGKYELQDRIGQGGMAEVWKALDTQLQRHVAIKFLHGDLRTNPDFLARFIREAQAIASLHHPNIVQVHDFQTAPDAEDGGSVAYMVMNYIEGPTLAQYLGMTSRIGQFPPAADILHVFSALGSAIDYAHRQGMIHRDIKPSNILFDARSSSRSSLGEPILTDFGLVKLLDAAVVTTQVGSVLGTPAYMAPEQVHGRLATELSDLYSLGVILYELCTGQVPFRGDGISAVMLQHLLAEPPDPALLNPAISPVLSEVILRCLAKDPTARFPTASALSLALAEAFNVSVPPAPLPTDGTVGRMFSLHPSSHHGTPLPSIGPLSAHVVLSQSQQQAAVRPTNTNVGEACRLDMQQRTTSVSLPSENISSLPSRFPFRRALGGKHRKLLLAVSSVLVLLVLSSAVLGVLSLASHQRPGTDMTAPIVGQAIFVSSGQLDQSDNTGLEDQMQIDLKEIAPPAPSRSYYGWLLSDKKQSSLRALPLGGLTVNHGRVSTLYASPAKDTNLLASYSRFLITEEESGKTPVFPAGDHRFWRYYAEIPQTPSSTGQQLRALDHIRDLLSLYQRGNIPPPGLHTALASQFLRNTYQVLAEARNARDNWDSKNPQVIHEQIIRMLDYLDSASFVRQDVPPGTALLVDPALVQVPLLDFSTEQYPASYFSRLYESLNGILASPGISPGMQQTATQALAKLVPVQRSLEKVRQDARQLARLANDQLLLEASRTLLDDMEMQASAAFHGQGTTATSPSPAGANWVVQKQIASLATFEVSAVPSRDN
jgi:serine/threonine protein kinase